MNDYAWHTHGGIRDASRTGDLGSVIRQARRVIGITQTQLAERAGLTQSAVSRLETAGVSDYTMATLAATAKALGLPFELVGLAARTSNGQSSVERREFLAAGLAAASLPLTAASLTGLKDQDPAQATALRAVTSSYRRLDSTTASSDLAEAVHGHLRLIQTISHSALEHARPALASAGSEAASFVGWLSWDMGDYGSARRWYSSSVKAAHASGDRLLTAYQAGSLASFEADTGSPHEALRLVAAVRRKLGCQKPELAAAWLSSIEAIAHATNGDRISCERALRATHRHAQTISPDEPAPWPWIFTFDERKVAACRVTCGARLTESRFPVSDQDITTALSSGHDKQRALLHLDVAARNIRVGDIDGAFHVATRALAEGIRLRSEKIVDKARRLRSTYASTQPPAVVHEFDDLLHSSYL